MTTGWAGLAPEAEVGLGPEGAFHEGGVPHYMAAPSRQGNGISTDGLHPLLDPQAVDLGAEGGSMRSMSLVVCLLGLCEDTRLSEMGTNVTPALDNSAHINTHAACEDSLKNCKHMPMLHCITCHPRSQCMTHCRFRHFVRYDTFGNVTEVCFAHEG